MIEKLRLIPTVEVNFPPLYVSDAARGLTAWRDFGGVRDGLVSTMPDQTGLFRELAAALTGVRIIRGLKTMNLLPTPDSLTGWKKVADQVRMLAPPTTAATRPVFFLENEKAFDAYVDGDMTIDLKKLAEGLRCLPLGIEYWWYPSIFGSTPDIQQRNEDVARVVQSTLARVRFVDQRYQGPAAVKDRWRLIADERLRAIRTLPSVPKIYFYGDDRYPTFWKDAQLGEALELVAKNYGAATEVLIYPGVARFAACAEPLARNWAALRGSTSKR